MPPRNMFLPRVPFKATKNLKDGERKTERLLERIYDLPEVHFPGQDYNSIIVYGAISAALSAAIPVDVSALIAVIKHSRHRGHL